MATTFSALIDSIIVELVRPDQIDNCVSWLNQTIRECHFRPTSNQQVFYDENRTETETLVASANPFLWPIPSVTRFQMMEAVYSNNVGIYIPAKNPRIALREATGPYDSYFYYRTGAQYAVAGVAVDDTIQMSYFQYPRMLAYRANVADRHCTFDPDSDMYYDITSGSPVASTDVQLEVETNWLLQRWDTVLAEGLRAKAYKRLGDDLRTRLSYSAFQTGLTNIFQSEPSSN